MRLKIEEMEGATGESSGEFQPGLPAGLKFRERGSNVMITGCGSILMINEVSDNR